MKSCSVNMIQATTHGTKDFFISHFPEEIDSGYRDHGKKAHFLLNLPLTHVVPDFSLSALCCTCITTTCITQSCGLCG